MKWRALLVVGSGVDVATLYMAFLIGCASQSPVERPAKGDPPASAPAQVAIPSSDYPTEREMFDRGFIPNPFSPNSGYLDIRGIPVGTEIRDPYTGKVFVLKRPGAK